MEEAKKARKTAKRLFTVSVKTLESLTTTSPTVEQITKAMVKMESLYDELYTTNETVLTNLPDDASDDLVDEHINYMNDVNKCRGEITQTISNIKANIDLAEKKQNEVSSRPIQASQPSKSQLERLKVQNFSGNVRDYPGWRQSFTHAMKKYCPDEEEQLQRLKEATSQNVRKEIAHCLSTSSAIEILDLSYGNKDELMSLLVNDIKAVQPMKTGGTQSLKAMATEIRTFIVRVRDLNKEHDLKADYIVFDLIEKLLPEDQYRYKVYCRDKAFTKSLETLANWLSEEAQLRVGTHEDIVTKKNRSHTYSSNAATTSANPKEARPCLIGCSDSHLLQDCPVFNLKNVSERWMIVKENRCCFSCLKKGHQTQACYNKKQCSKQECSKSHNVLLHANELQTNQGQTNASHAVFQLNAIIGGNLPVLKVRVVDDYGVEHEGIAMIDSGSQQSLIRKSFARKLRLHSTKPIDLQIQLAGGGTMIEKSSNFDLKVSALYEPEASIFKLNAMSLETVCGDIAPMDKEVFVKYPHLAGIAKLIHQDGGKVDLLIGTNFPTAFREIGSCCVADQDAPIAKQTPLGWVVLGAMPCSTNLHVNTVSVMAEPNIAKLFEIDSLGVKPTKACTCSESELNETAFINHVKENVRFQPDGRLEMKMPWKQGHPSLPDNRAMAMKRLTSLESRLGRENKTDEYNEEVRKLVEDKFCVKLTDVDWSKPFWLLPHRAVERPEASSTKLRIVFDSAAECGGVCLNDALEKGPNYLNDLFKVLVGWRQDVIAYCGDIRKMFNMIAIHPDDQPYHRFLWRDGDTSKPPDVYQWTRLSFGDKSSPDLACSAIRLLADQHGSEAPNANIILKEHIYMDDIADSKADEVEVQNTIKEVDQVLQSGRFTIKAWHSNNQNINQSNENAIPILGHIWDKNTDSLSLKTKDFNKIPEILTKRKVFGIIAQCWDPLGLLSPCLIKLKIAMQDVWSQGFGWDEELPSDQATKWKELFCMLDDLQLFETDRSFKPSDSVGFPQLHGFSDGGEFGYGSCVFLRWCLQDGSTECRLVAAKSFVAPLKRKTIPRLELMGCVTLSRLVDTIVAALRTQVESIVLWTDSSTALSWIRSPPRSFKPFVGVRIAEIQETYDPIMWRYVPSECNPADALTKGIPARQLTEWHKGPSFLKLPETDWPIREDLKKSDKHEAERKPVKIAAAQVIDDVAGHFAERSKDWRKMCRHAAIWMRYLNNIKATCQSDQRVTGNITAEELIDGERCLIKLAQKNVDFTDHNLVKVDAFKDEKGVWRAKGRLELADNLPYDLCYPIILPNSHQYAKRILEQLHRKLGHPGYKRLMAEMRQRYWVTGLQKLAKSTCSKCLLCNRLRRPLGNQQMGPLPPFRADAGSPAFANTSVDLFGPLKVKVARRTLDKAYGCLFTCLSTRAVHTELVTDESTDQFLMALRRFAALRGWPKFIFSDNGTNFVGAQTVLRDIINEWNLQKVQHQCTENGTMFEWKFNCPTASHMNGAVESMIKSIRRAIDGTCGFASYSQTQWATILYEVSHIVNSRPLYPSSDDIFDAPPITPNMLLLGNQTIPQPEAQDIVNPRHLHNSVQQRIQLFWEQWMRHFAPTLAARTKWFHPREDLAVGDLCILLDPHHPRAQWKLALVEELQPSADGRIRKVKIKTSTGRYERPIHKLSLIATNEELSATRT